MISTGDLRRGAMFELDGQIVSVIEFQHQKIGRGSAQVRMRLRNVRTGAIFDRTVQAGEKWVSTAFEHGNVLVWPAAGVDLKLIEEDGWYSERYGLRQPRKAFCYRHAATAAPATFVTLLVPYRGRERPECRVDIPPKHRAGESRVELRGSAFGKTWRIGRDVDEQIAWSNTL